MKIKGSKDRFYEVNVENQTCTCKDWSCRRHNFPIGDEKRLCKHLKEAIRLMSTYSPLKSQFTVPEDLIHRIESMPSVLSFNALGDTLLVELLEGTSLNDLLMYLGCSQAGDNMYVYEFMTFRVIECNSYNYLFRRLFYSLSKDKYIELSSVIIHRWGYVLTPDGLIDQNANFVDLDIHSEEELYDILGLSVLI